jgi:uncharacterized protein YkwD
MILKSSRVVTLGAVFVAACGDGQATDPLFHINVPAVDAGLQNLATGPDSAVAMDATTTGNSVGNGDGSANNPRLDSGNGLQGDGDDDDAGSSGDGDFNAQGETGRMLGVTAAHNAVRAKVSTTPALPPLTWSPTLAAYAQEWADHEAATECSNAQHRSKADLMSVKYGENLAEFRSGGFGGLPPSGNISTAQDAVNGWASEIACWTYGTIEGTEACDLSCATVPPINSDGCGHYTQIVWRDTLRVGCGVANCEAGSYHYEIWICNYDPPGNYKWEAPY